MKINDYLMAFTAAAYSYLFYEQNAGINFLIFNLLFLCITIYRNQLVMRDRRWLWGAAMCIVSSAGIMAHSSVLAILSNCVSLLLVSAFSFRKQTSAAFSFLFSCYSVATSAVMLVYGLTKTGPGKEKRSSGIRYKIGGAAIVFALTLLFLGLYRLSNPLFAVNTKWMNLNFISVSWVAFTLIGFLVVYGLYYHRTVSFVEDWENNLPMVNLPGGSQTSVKLDTERSSGMLLFGLLNGMLLILNAGDINTLWLGSKLPAGISHSDFVHHGVETIILSIIIAAGLIMFLFRRDFAAQKNARLLKILVFAWIIQTIIMLISTASRNQMYIQEFSLTYKRIGVYVWLILAVTGLGLTTEKILRERSNWFLVKTNVNLWFTMLALSSLLNWDLIITRYNLANKPLHAVDFEYLFWLSETNIPELIGITRLKEFPAINEKMKIIGDTRDYNYLLHQKIKGYLGNYNNNWQSWDLSEKRITESILEQ